MAGPVGGEFRGARRRLIETLQANGITDLAVLHAVDEVPRHVFVPQAVLHRAYEDSALPIGNGQTISQPTVHARSLQELRLTGRERVLEIGTGSGYQTAILARLARRVTTVERFRTLSKAAEARWQALGLRNISAVVADGFPGWPRQAPFDRILVAVALPAPPARLIAQLSETGILVAPIGSERQRLTLFQRIGERIDARDLGGARFEPILSGIAQNL